MVLQTGTGLRGWGWEAGAPWGELGPLGPCWCIPVSAPESQARLMAEEAWNLRVVATRRPFSPRVPPLSLSDFSFFGL